LPTSTPSPTARAAAGSRSGLPGSRAPARPRSRTSSGPLWTSAATSSSTSTATRSARGLYAKAYAGEIKGFTGVDDPYEAPESPEIVVDTEAQTPEESAQIVVARLEELGLIGSEVRA
jgi:hypothetical protein